MKDYQASQSARSVLVQGLQAVNPKLVRGQDCVTAAKNIRTELKAAFPKVKFSVTSDKFAGGNAVRITYTDGPCSESVEAICEKYQTGNFNSMEDLYEYDNDNLWTDAFGSSKYVTVNRNFSDASIAAAIEIVNAKYGETLATVEDYRNGNCRHRPSSAMSNYDVQSLIYQAMRIRGDQNV